MHQLKQQAQMMKEALLKGRLHEIGEILDFGFQQKRKMASGISNELMDEIYETAKAAGATRRQNIRSRRRRIYDLLLPGKYEIQCRKKFREIWRCSSKLSIC